MIGGFLEDLLFFCPITNAGADAGAISVWATTGVNVSATNLYAEAVTIFVFLVRGVRCGVESATMGGESAIMGGAATGHGIV